MSTWARWATVCLLLLALPLQAQNTSSEHRPRISPWGLIDAVGYGALGTGFGAAVSLGSPWEDAEASVLIFTAVGVISGSVIGHTAGSKLRSGRRVGGTHRFFTSMGAAGAGAGIGSLAAFFLINGEGSGTALGSDEATFAATAAIGAAAGTAYALYRQREFTQVRVAIAPYRSRTGVGAQLRVRF